jgi:hypothetical protein
MSESPGIFVEFFIEPVHMTFKSQEAGRPIYEDREFKRITIAGDRNSQPVSEVTDYDRERFAEVYARFKRGMLGREQQTGTPLKEWPLMTASQIKELHGLDIYTVEALASLSDTQKQALGMGAHNLVASAKAWLESSKDGAAAAFYAAKNESLLKEVEDLKRQIAELAANQQEEKRGPGRPPKAARETMLEI